MARRDSQECQRRPFRLATVLFPVAKGVHTDAERAGGLALRQANETTESRHIAGLKLAAHDALTLAAAQRSREIG